MTHDFLPGKNNICEVTPEGNFRKRFVVVKPALGYMERPYEAPDPDSFERELKGYEALKPFFNVPTMLSHDREQLSIDYEFLEEVTRLDQVVAESVVNGRVSEGCIKANSELGQRLRWMHDETYTELRKTVPGINDFVDVNVFVANEGMESGYHILFDFETFDPNVNVYSAILAMPMSELITAATFNSKDTEFNAAGMEAILPAVRAFFLSYFSGSTPLWLTTNGGGESAYDLLRQNVYFTALRSLSPKHTGNSERIMNVLASQLENLVIL